MTKINIKVKNLEDKVKDSFKKSTTGGKNACECAKDGNEDIKRVWKEALSLKNTCNGCKCGGEHTCNAEAEWADNPNDRTATREIVNSEVPGTSAFSGILGKAKEVANILLGHKNYTKDDINNLDFKKIHQAIEELDKKGAFDILKGNRLIETTKDINVYQNLNNIYNEIKKKLSDGSTLHCNCETLQEMENLSACEPNQDSISDSQESKSAVSKYGNKSDVGRLLGKMLAGKQIDERDVKNKECIEACKNNEHLAKALNKRGVFTDGYEMVNHPQHYNNYDVEVIDMMVRVFGVRDTIAFCKLNAFKYRMRAGTKPDTSTEQDIQKEIWYLKKAEELKKDLI